MNAFNEIVPAAVEIEEQPSTIATIATTTTIDDIAKQIEQFETSLGDYDTLVTSLCCQSVDNNSNS